MVQGRFLFVLNMKKRLILKGLNPFGSGTFFIHNYGEKFDDFCLS
ncbi:hypothetical protein HMPREF9080_02626 [Cardiobacterium valvarum F0432]|uniref:Uncharacterized protein n=1 Tax=Cardiobacterium valvarum F0432 TaxID=797473 RepID=G9ZIL5_9GAMM|nr:hypothetical protein HMPREF9080_02626 [Cardiobacterium valvarum F0432]